MLEKRFPLLTTSRISSLDRKRLTRGSKLPLGAELGATLATAGGQNCSTSTGAHAGTEAVVLSATAVVRLESALGHFKLLKLMGAMP